MSAYLDRGRFAQAVTGAVAAAAATAAGRHTIDTRDLLLALMKADLSGEWERIWLHFASPQAVASAVVADPRPEPTPLWDTIQTSGTCAAALIVAGRIADAYDMEPVQVGVAALGLVADPASAAAQALTGGDDRQHPALLEAVQDAIVGTNLVGLVEVVRAAVSGEVDGDRGDTDGGDPDGPGPFEAVAADLGGVERLAERDALALLAAAIRQVRDPGLAQRLGRLLIDADAVESVRSRVADLPGPSAAELVDRARDRFDTLRPDARQLIVATAHRACAPVARALWLLGTSPTSVAFAAAEADAHAYSDAGKRRGDPVSDSTGTAAMLNALLSVATSIFIVRSAVGTHQWWLLALIFVAWTGHPVLTLLMTGVLGWTGDGVATMAALALTVADLVLVRTERRTALFRTGILLTTRDWRRHVRIRHAGQAAIVTRLVQWRRVRRLAGGAS